MMNQPTQPIVTNSKDDEELDYTDPNFNWNMVDEQETIISQDNPFFEI